ncbi:MAG TPA: response regulator [Gammaproteobacteria bacterium]|nr:response regulator [Gammaproteobacteria bacterium]
MSNLEKEKLFEIKQIITVISNKVAVPLYFLFWFLDILYVPQYKWEFLGIRILIIPTALIIHWWLKNTNSIIQAEYAGLFLAFVCASILNFMIFIIGKGALYYIPLHLVAIGGLSFIPWNNRNFFIAIILIYGPYLALEANWIAQSGSVAEFGVNLFFIVGVIMVTWTIKSYREKLHTLELSLRFDLENEIEKRKETEKELTIARDRAIAATRAKESFLANMSHEIRTPLTAIIGYADTGLDHDQTTQQRITALKTIRHSGNHLLGLINDILDFSKIEAGEFEIEKTLINPLQQVYEVEPIIMGHAKKKGLKFIIDYTFPVPKEINCNAVRLKQILINLCNNAIKFTDAGEVKITVQYHSEKHQLDFIVQDTGIGMTKEQLNKIFKPFKQADSSTARRYGGTGLGLSLSTQLAGLLGGKLVADSETDKGSIFTFCLNLDDKSERQFYNNIDEVTFSKESDSADTRMKNLLKGDILVVEDNAVNQELIRMYLEKMGARVSCVDNGSIAVSLAKDHTYDLIYMDMQMPVMSGIEAVTILRNNNYKQPIVMLTANATADNKSECIEAGANDFVTKPIVRQKLYETTAKYLEVAVSHSYQGPIYSALIQEEPSFKDLLYNFVDSLRKMQQQIVYTFRNEEFYALAQAVHDLKGTAGGFGYPDLSKLAEEIETRLKEKDTPAIEKLVEDLGIMCERIYQGAQHT